MLIWSSCAPLSPSPTPAVAAARPSSAQDAVGRQPAPGQAGATAGRELLQRHGRRLVLTTTATNWCAMAAACWPLARRGAGALPGARVRRQPARRPARRLHPGADGPDAGDAGELCRARTSRCCARRAPGCGRCSPTASSTWPSCRPRPTRRRAPCCAPSAWSGRRRRTSIPALPTACHAGAVSPEGCIFRKWALAQAAAPARAPHRLHQPQHVGDPGGGARRFTRSRSWPRAACRPTPSC